jgi:hypothetical protein
VTPLISASVLFGTSTAQYQGSSSGGLTIHQWSYAGEGYSQLVKEYTYYTQSFACPSTGTYGLTFHWWATWSAKMYLGGLILDSAAGGRVSINLMSYVWDVTMNSVVPGSFSSVSLVDKSKSNPWFPYDKTWSSSGGYDFSSQATLTAGHIYKFYSGVVINTMATQWGEFSPFGTVSEVKFLGQFSGVSVTGPTSSYATTQYCGGGGGGRFYYQ